jgi:hypothetical protein
VAVILRSPHLIGTTKNPRSCLILRLPRFFSRKAGSECQLASVFPQPVKPRPAVTTPLILKELKEETLILWRRVYLAGWRRKAAPTSYCSTTAKRILKRLRENTSLVPQHADSPALAARLGRRCRHAGGRLEPPGELARREKMGEGASGKADKMSFSGAHHKCLSSGRTTQARNSRLSEGPSLEATSPPPGVPTRDLHLRVRCSLFREI